MTYFAAVLYGFIQGLGEFLPISSSGHLALLPHLIDIEDPGVLFDLLMHIGTVGSLVVFFRKEIYSLLRESIAILQNRQLTTANHFFLTNQIFATFASVLGILFLKSYSEDMGRSPTLIAFNLIFFGAVLVICEIQNKRSKKKSTLEKSTKIHQSMLIGLAQAFAIFPGVSRSGITISAALVSGLSKTEASRFSFLLSIPIIIAATAYKATKIKSSDLSFNLGHALVGIGVSFITGYLCLKLFFALLPRVPFMLYFGYRFLIALAVLLLV